MKTIILAGTLALLLLGPSTIASACTTPEQFSPHYSDAVQKAVAAAQARAAGKR
ncbi:MAG: hypothetical protein K2X60_06395 [Xanthobacteraceae bacterium]|nr:hypothetical protein [Xanthobacteraceae bacterium]